jgi:3-oxoacyl-[acyl-carrier-protein] synthase-3
MGRPEKRELIVRERQIHLRAVGTALPGPPIDNAALARRLGMGERWQEWIEAFIGTRSRHLSVDLDSGEQRATLGDLCHDAAHAALSAGGFEPEDVDVVVLATATPDLLMPATVNVVADTLGVDGVPSFQLQSGCTGAVQALSLAERMLAGDGPRTALVIGGDISARYFDFDADLTRLPPDEMVHYVLFGDGAGAAVLSTEPGPDSVTVRHLFTRLDGLGRAPGQTLDWFGPVDRDSDRKFASENYKAIEELVPPMTVGAKEEVCALLGWTESDIDFVLPPQLSGRMSARLFEELAIPGAKDVSCVAETGNNGNATPFFQLEHAFREMAPGQRALGVCIESSKWISAGFALEKEPAR